MAKRGGPKHVPFPTREQVAEFIKTSEGRVGRREIARAFSIRGDDRRRLTELLKELQHGGEVEKHRGRKLTGPGQLPDTTEIIITGTDRDGELIARPLEWKAGTAPPRIIMAPQRDKQPLGVGDHVLAKLRRVRGTLYEGRAIRRLAEGPTRVLGLYQRNERGEGRLLPTDRRQKAEYLVTDADANGASPGELVAAEILPGRAFGLRPARVVERLGSMSDPRAVSLISIHTHDIPYVFPADALREAKEAGPAPLGQRTDLRSVPLITIDGEDARDFDDAVWAEPAEGNGWHVIVAIADVSWYVRTGDPLDNEARRRGNSVYFPDRVVPMLPEELSNGWCSLKPKEDRPCMVVHLWLDSDGNRQRYKFERALMRSAARLTYNQVQAALDGKPDDITDMLLEPVLRPLESAWKALNKERQRRGTMELELAERQVIIGPDGRIAAIKPRARLNAHRLIEDFMIAANVAAAEQIEAVHQPCMYRVHDQPSPERLEALRVVLESLGLNLPKGGRVTPGQFNIVLAKASQIPEARMVNEMILRSQAQAVYSPDNIGHFGLGLARYAHFTSPIRRYADLLVHRAIIAGLKLGDGGLLPGAVDEFHALGEIISGTERRAATAERDALDRFTVLYLADRVGATFEGTVSGVQRYGLFITLDETGADGLLPVSALPEDFYFHDEQRQTLTGRRSGQVYKLGDGVTVRLAEANTLTGSLSFQIGDGGPMPPRRGSFKPGSPRPKRGGPPPGVSRSKTKRRPDQKSGKKQKSKGKR
ncbi:MAG TPA: ribonuclease R [Magnetospirillaceae bacterium]